MAKVKAPSGRPWTPQYLRARARHFRSWTGGGFFPPSRCDGDCRELFILGEPPAGTVLPLSERNRRAAEACESLAMEGR